jgi:hypothetical protein
MHGPTLKEFYALCHKYAAVYDRNAEARNI